MRFTIQREALVKLLRAVAGAVEKRHAQLLPILSHVLLEVRGQQLKLTTTDQEVELITSVELIDPTEPGKLAVSFRKLMDICRALPEGVDILFSLVAERLIISAGKSRFTLSTLPADHFPNLSESTVYLCHLTMLRENFRALIERTCLAMAEQDVRYYLNGMLLELKATEVTAVASDGHRLAMGTMNAIAVNNAAQALRIIIPRKGVLEIQRILEEGGEEISLAIGSNHLRLATEQVTMTSKLLEGKFPDYERIIPKGGDKIVMGSRLGLKEAFFRASVLHSDKSRGVQLRLSSGRLKILATNTEQDAVEEDFEVDYTGGDLDIGFNVKYLIDFLGVIPTEQVKFTFMDANSSARIEGVDHKTGIYVVMPMKI